MNILERLKLLKGQNPFQQPVDLDKTRVASENLLRQRAYMPASDPASPNAGFEISRILRAMASENVPEEIKQQRLAICAECTATENGDPNGDRLFREIKGKLYCGRPRLQKLWRDEALFGCGCNLNMKAAKALSACPLGKWLAVKQEQPTLKPGEQISEKIVRQVAEHVGLELLEYNWPAASFRLKTDPKEAFGKVNANFLNVKGSTENLVRIIGGVRDLYRGVNNARKQRKGGCCGGGRK